MKIGDAAGSWAVILSCNTRVNELIGDRGGGYRDIWHGVRLPDRRTVWLSNRRIDALDNLFLSLTTRLDNCVVIRRLDLSVDRVESVGCVDLPGGGF